MMASAATAAHGGSNGRRRHTTRMAAPCLLGLGLLLQQAAGARAATAPACFLAATPSSRQHQQQQWSRQQGREALSLPASSPSSLLLLPSVPSPPRAGAMGQVVGAGAAAAAAGARAPALAGSGKRARLARALGRGFGGVRQWAATRVAAARRAGRAVEAVPSRVGKKRMTLAASWLLTCLAAVSLQAAAPGLARAMALPAPSGDGPAAPSPLSPWQRGLILSGLFVVSAAFHAAETSITTLYPWKVREFAKEEGDSSPFKILDKDITRVLTTILVATTACTIYSAALFTNLAMELLGPRGVAYSTVGLTVVTLVFGELIPKSLGVSNAEMVARIMVPPINLLAVVLSPVGKVLSMFAKLVLRVLGVKADDDERVSEDQLRLLVAGAQKSGGIEAQEGQMINQVLNMQEKRVSEAMCPRVDVEALDKRATLHQLQELFQKTRYSRIPVFDGEIDKIIGVAMSKDLLEYVFSKDQGVMDEPVEAIMQPTYFVPETMTIWTCFQEMRQRRVHMAIVVDEYGGTAGVITLEDIQEEVFGEIYDEEDIEEDHHGEDLIKMIEDDVYLIQGNADLEDVCQTLGLEMNEEQRGDFATFGGYLCSLAGEIPAVSDHIVVPDYVFTIVQADERRIIEVRVERVYVAEEGDEPERPTGEEAEEYELVDFDEEMLESGEGGNGRDRQGADVGGSGGGGRVFAAGGGGGGGGKQRQA